MKHILVPTDFSECAQYALEAAILLAKKFNATLHLYSCLELPENWFGMSSTEQKSFPDALQQIEATTDTFNTIIKHHSDLEISASYSSGKLVEEIQSCIQEKGIDFLVMGSHGKSGISEIFIGSNTQKVVRMIHRPILVVKRPLKNIDFKNVVFASSFNLSEKKPFLEFKKIIAPFKPVIHFLGIMTSYFFDVPVAATKSAMDDFVKLGRPFECKTYIFKTSNIETGVRQFSKEIDADLIAISNHNRRPLKRMLMGSNVEALINHSELPVLSIDYEADN
jgi:nucleotide-binding universal stress UspA family protein